MVPARPFSHPGLLQMVQIGGLMGMNSKSFWAIQWPFGQLIETKLKNHIQYLVVRPSWVRITANSMCQLDRTELN